MQDPRWKHEYLNDLVGRKVWWWRKLKLKFTTVAVSRFLAMTVGICFKTDKKTYYFQVCNSSSLWKWMHATVRIEIQFSSVQQNRIDPLSPFSPLKSISFCKRKMYLLYHEAPWRRWDLVQNCTVKIWAFFCISDRSDLL